MSIILINFTKAERYCRAKFKPITMKAINVDQAVELMKSTKGKVFTAIFTKKDGTTRTMNCRTGVHKNLTGVGLKFDPMEKMLFGVYDMNNGYRFINLRGLKGLQVAGKSYSVEQVNIYA